MFFRSDYAQAEADIIAWVRSLEVTDENARVTLQNVATDLEKRKHVAFNYGQLLRDLEDASEEEEVDDG